QAEDGIRDFHVTGVQTCALPISDAGASDATILVCEIRDISARGMSLLSRLALNVESMLTAEVSLDSSQAPFRLMVEVVWCREDGRGYLVGIRVLESDETDYLAWMDAVAEAFSES